MTPQLLDQIAELLKQIPDDVLRKATYQLGGTVTSALTFYDLEEEAKIFVPEITPLVRMVPRVKGVGGTATQWDAITAINSGDLPMGIAEGKRGGIIAVSSARNTAPYATIGLDSTLTFEQDLAAMGHVEQKPLQIRNLLQAAMIGEERVMLGGNFDVALGTTPTVTATGAITGGALANGTFHVRCVALTLAAYRRASLALGIPTTHAYVRGGGATTTVNAGAAIVSADATGVVASGSTGSIACSVTAVPGAVAYAWFLGAAGGAAGAEVLNKITTTNKATLTAVRTTVTPGTGYADTVGTAFDADRSSNNLLFNGLISIIAKTGSNSLFASTDDAQLTTDGAGGCVEINTDLQAFYENNKVSPTHMFVGAQVLMDLTRLIVKNGGAPLLRVMADKSAASLAIVGGSIVTAYLNKTANAGSQEIPILLHPDMPPGAILYYSARVPYPVPSVNNIIQVKTQQEWGEIDWPLTEREWPVGLYAREVLQCYYPPAYGWRGNIKAGIA